MFMCVMPAAAADAPTGRSEAPAGQMTWGVHTTLVPTYFDPAETIIGTSYMMLYALHDALVKPLPGQNLAPSLAESWTVSPDGLVYEFVLRRGARFHNGEPVQQRLALGPIEHGRLLAEQPLDIGIGAVDERAAGGNVRLQRSRRGAETAGADELDEALELLLRDALVEGGALERAELGPDVEESGSASSRASHSPPRTRT